MTSRFNVGSRERTCILCGSQHLAYHMNAQSSFCEECYRPELRREEVRVEQQRKRAERGNLPSTLTVLEWITIVNHFKWRCAYCGGRFEIMEHIISIVDEGGTIAGNVVPGCSNCNSRKDLQKCMETSLISSVRRQLEEALRNPLGELIIPSPEPKVIVTSASPIRPVKAKAQIPDGPFRVWKLAEAQGLDITQLADKAGMDYSMVYRVWMNKTKRPAISTLESIAKALGVPVWALFADAPMPTGV